MPLRTLGQLRKIGREFAVVAWMHRRERLCADEAVRDATAHSFKSIEQLADALGANPAEFFTSDLPKGVVSRRGLNDLTAKIGGLTDDDLLWLGRIVDAALAPRR